MRKRISAVTNLFNTKAINLNPQTLSIFESSSQALEISLTLYESDLINLQSFVAIESF